MNKSNTQYSEAFAVEVAGCSRAEASFIYIYIYITFTKDSFQKMLLLDLPANAGFIRKTGVLNKVHGLGFGLITKA